MSCHDINQTAELIWLNNNKNHNYNNNNCVPYNGSAIATGPASSGAAEAAADLLPRFSTSFQTLLMPENCEAIKEDVNEDREEEQHTADFVSLSIC